MRDVFLSLLSEACISWYWVSRRPAFFLKTPCGFQFGSREGKWGVRMSSKGCENWLQHSCCMDSTLSEWVAGCISAPTATLTDTLTSALLYQPFPSSGHVFAINEIDMVFVSQFPWTGKIASRIVLNNLTFLGKNTDFYILQNPPAMGCPVTSLSFAFSGDWFPLSGRQMYIYNSLKFLLWISASFLPSYTSAGLK